MRKLFTAILEKLKNHEDSVLVSIVASSGSTPRGAGARMLVGSEGRVTGTIGGGAVEYRSIRLAQEVLKGRKSALRRFTLDKNQAEDLGMVCGGDATVFFRFLDGGDARLPELCRAALRQFQEQQTTWLMMELTDAPEGEIGLYSEKSGLVGKISPGVSVRAKGRAGTWEFGGRKYFAEQIVAGGFVYIFGGGHVSRELVPALSRLDFRCIVLEDRPEFASRELFPGALDVRMVNFEDLRGLERVTPSDYMIVLTRGHRCDQAVVEQALKTPAGYIGVIGSRHKKAVVEQNLLDRGFRREDLARITAPIGLLGIRAETPAEIAVSIAGQLIAFRAGAGIVR